MAGMQYAQKRVARIMEGPEAMWRGRGESGSAQKRLCGRNKQAGKVARLRRARAAYRIGASGLNQARIECASRASFVLWRISKGHGKDRIKKKEKKRKSCFLLLVSCFIRASTNNISSPIDPTIDDLAITHQRVGRRNAQTNQKQHPRHSSLVLLRLTSASLSRASQRPPQSRLGPAEPPTNEKKGNTKHAMHPPGQRGPVPVPPGTAHAARQRRTGAPRPAIDRPLVPCASHAPSAQTPSLGGCRGRPAVGVRWHDGLAQTMTSSAAPAPT